MTTMAVGPLHHIALSVPELAPALAFYEGCLGLKALDRPALSSKGAWLDAGAVQLHLIQTATPASGFGAAHGRQSHLAFHVEDYDRALHHLRGLGLEITEGVVGIRQFFVYDPAGNTVEFICAD
jgi:glyoxylase I family protein